MLDVLGVVPELLDQLVVVVVGVGVERLVALEDDHRVAVGVELLEVGADALHRDECRRVVGVHRHGVGFAHLLQGRNEDVGDDRQGNPAQHDGHRQYPDRVCDLGAFGGRSTNWGVHQLTRPLDQA